MSAATATVGAAAGSGARFEDLASSLARIPDVIRAIPDMIREPGANPTQTMLLLAVVVTLVLLLLISIVLLAMRPPRRVAGPVHPDPEGTPTLPRRTVPRDRTGWRSPAVGRLLVASVVLIVASGLLAVAGVTSGDRSACITCHSDSPHAAAAKTDPHSGIACVSCHESGGSFARATFNVPARFQHFIAGSRSAIGQVDYGLPIASDACRECHGSRIARVVVDTARGVRMSHAEPLAAGAECVDCHTLESGRIASSSGGMDPCRRCHGTGTVFSTCDRCHTGDPALAARSRGETATVTAKALVPNPTCDGCHTSQKTCDACHGIRMPHTVEFTTGGGHARAAAEDIWNNGGRSCKKCHYEGHRPCGQCHTPFPGHPASFKVLHQAGDPGTGCGCHKWDAKARGMTFCQLCHPTASSKAN